ncbi:MAG: HTTM domain-containing protein [Bacteroidota bacterium]
MSSLTTILHRPVPIGTLVFLRIALGLLGGGDILGNGIYYHWYKDAFAGYTFRYFGFEWVHPLPEPFFSLFFIVGFLLGVAVALGWKFRITAPLFALAFSYLFLLEKAHYLNHAYLFTWLAWVLVFTPAWREFSLDVRRRPEEWSGVAPAWSVFIFPALMGVVYFFGGIAKMNYDWLIRAMPLHMWLERRADMPILGPIWTKHFTAYVMAWGGMLLDLLSPFLLLHRRLRWLALGLLVLFHATNHLIFNIGIFPYLSMVLTSMFFAPDWPNRAVAWFSAHGRPIWARTRVQTWRSKWQHKVAEGTAASSDNYSLLFRRQLHPWLLPALVTLFAVHLTLPLRHWTFDSDVTWSEEGHRYSWRMMLRSKQGTGHFELVDRSSGETELVYPHDSLYNRQYRKMMTHPDMILQYAHHLRDLRQEAGQDVAIYGKFRVRLNGRQYVPFVDPEVDLATTEWEWFSTKAWVLPEERR